MKVYVRLAFMPVHEQIALAEMAEQLGFDGVTIPDHVFFPHVEPGTYPYTSDGQLPFPLESPWPDAVALISAVAARTSRLELLTTIYVLPLRHPLITARAIGTASVISGGRVTLGIGTGWMPEEFGALAVPLRERGSRTDESIEVLRKLWRPGIVEHSGRHFSFGPLLMEPVPDPPPAIMIGGGSPAALRRAVALGDGWAAPQPIEEIPGASVRLREQVAAAGRDPDAFTIYLRCEPEVDAVLRVAAEGEIAGLMPWPEPWTVSIDEKKRALERAAHDVLRPVREATG